tara:strand:- start:2008 stop:2193 length:186 start_codon:yes stop_codon:yes gene_type:complete
MSDSESESENEDELLDILSTIQLFINLIEERNHQNSKWNDVIEALINYYQFLNDMFMNNTQ